MLALLQRDGRLVDFLEEDVSSYPDGQLGAAVRSIHTSCRQAPRGDHPASGLTTRASRHG